ncbi:hypothetical protein HAX54_008840, partial [Datura stramonium]|nr:hypothetical protein [Datura stramonium]
RWFLRIKVSRDLEKAKRGLVLRLARRFGAKAVEPYGITWFNTQKEAKYAPENWIDKGHLALEELVVSSMSRR